MGVRRLLYWVNQYAVAPDQPGGTRHYDMARELVSFGLPVTLVASDFNLTLRRYLRRKTTSDPRYIREAHQTVNFAWLPAGGYKANDWRRALSMMTFAIHTVVFLMRAPMPQGSVIIGSSPHLLAAAAARLVALIRRTPFVLEVRDLWPESLAVGGASKGILYRLLRLLADTLYRSSNQIVVLAQGNIHHITERGVPDKRIHYVPNGVDIANFKEAKPVPLPRVPSDSQAFIYAGAHGPANGLGLLLSAAQHLAHIGETSIHIVLLGDGPSKQELIESAQRMHLQNVTFLKPVPKDQMPGLLKACAGGLMILSDLDLFRYGVSPNKLFDYLCADLPVITNVQGEVAAMVLEAEAGIVVPPDSPEALAQAMIAVSHGQCELRNGITWVEEHHDRSHLAAKLHQVLETAAKGS